MEDNYGDHTLKSTRLMYLTVPPWIIIAKTLTYASLGIWQNFHHINLILTTNDLQGFFNESVSALPASHTGVSVCFVNVEYACT